MSVTLTQDVAGKRAGETYSGPEEDWLLVNGYARNDDGRDMVDVTGVVAAQDPTLAENREAPGEDVKGFGKADEKQLEASGPAAVNGKLTLGETEDAETQKVRDELAAGADVKVSDKAPAPQVKATKAAEKAAGTGDRTLNEPTA